MNSLNRGVHGINGSQSRSIVLASIAVATGQRPQRRTILTLSEAMRNWPFTAPATHHSSAVISHSQIRHKTFRKTDTDRRKQWIVQANWRKLRGLPRKETRPVKMETDFYKIVDGMKIYKAITPGMRNRRHPTRFHLHKGSALRRLSKGKRSTGGRNCHGRISVRHRGGGHKKRIRTVDFKRATPGEYQVLRFEYDPNRTGELMLLRSMSTNEFSYIIRPQEVAVGSQIYSFPRGIPMPAPGENPLPKTTVIRPGNCLPLKDIPVGTFIHCIALKADGPGILCRSAGAGAQIMSRAPNGYVQIRLTSQEVRMIHGDCIATIGMVANENHKHRNWGKAGARRHKGWRPSVRGIAMNPMDHPHGGGRKSKGGKAARSPWGWLTKGPKTVKRKRWFIVTPRWKAVEQKSVK